MNTGWQGIINIYMTIITCTSPLHLYFYKEFASVFGNEEKQQQNFQSLLTDFPEFMKIDTDIVKSDIAQYIYKNILHLFW